MPDNPDSQKPEGQAATAEQDEQFRKLRADLDRALGKLLQLAAKTPGWAQRPVRDIYEKALPPLVTKQYRFVVNDEGDAMSYISWAMVSPEVEKKLAAQESIALADWQSGDIGFVVDVIAPNPRASTALVGKLKMEMFADKPLKAMRMSKEGAELAEVPSAATQH